MAFDKAELEGEVIALGWLRASLLFHIYMHINTNYRYTLLDSQASLYFDFSLAVLLFRVAFWLSVTRSLSKGTCCGYA